MAAELSKDEIKRGFALRHTAKWCKWVWSNIDSLMAMADSLAHQRYLVQELQTDVMLRDQRIRILEEQAKHRPSERETT